MDELIIDDKKYVSSKRAAQITGYAKDYVGQLCREGYVDAKRVGRSWYVLEAGIKDHRFGGGHADEATATSAAPVKSFTIERPVAEMPVQSGPPAPAPVSGAPSAPHYAAIAPPSINLLQRDEVQVAADDPKLAASTTPSQDFHEAWQAWFDAFHQPHESRGADREPIVDTRIPSQLPEAGLPESAGHIDDDEEVSVPIRQAAPEPPKHLSPRPDAPVLEVRMEEAMRHVAPGRRLPQRTGSRGAAAQITSGILVFIAIVSIGFALLNSGSLDYGLSSVSQADWADGLSIYNK